MLSSKANAKTFSARPVTQNHFKIIFVHFYFFISTISLVMKNDYSLTQHSGVYLLIITGFQCPTLLPPRNQGAPIAPMPRFASDIQQSCSDPALTAATIAHVWRSITITAGRSVGRLTIAAARTVQLVTAFVSHSACENQAPAKPR